MTYSGQGHNFIAKLKSLKNRQFSNINLLQIFYRYWVNRRSNRESQIDIVLNHKT